MNYKIRRLDRYLANQFFPPFFLAVGGFTIIGAVDILFVLIEQAVVTKVPYWIVCKLLVYKLPAVMVLFFPMAVIFSVMLLWIRMAKDQELTLLRTSGIGLLRIWAPLAVYVFCVTGMSYAINDRVVPIANRASDAIIQNQIQNIPPPKIVENIVFKEGSRFFYVKKADRDTHTMESVLIFDTENVVPCMITAKKATWNQVSWMLQDGWVYHFDQEGEMTQAGRFETTSIYVSNVIKYMYDTPQSPRDMTSSALKQKIMLLKKSGVNTNDLDVEFFLKKSIPFACAIFGALGIVLSMTFVNTGKEWGGIVVAICGAVVAVGFYFFLVAMFRAFGKDGQLGGFWAAWMPNIIYMIPSVCAMIYRSVRH